MNNCLELNIEKMFAFFMYGKLLLFVSASGNADFRTKENRGFDFKKSKFALGHQFIPLFHS